MIAPWTANIILFFFGALIGIYVPVVGLYLLVSWKSTNSWLQAVWTIIKRLAAATFGAFTVLAISGYVFDKLSLSNGELPEQGYVCIGFGFTGALMFGVWLGFLAFRRRRKSNA